MSAVERINNLFPRCPICKSSEGYKPSIFHPLVVCKSCKSEWAVYDYGMELKSTSETGLIRELLDKKYSFDFWKGELKPQITSRIFAPMSCLGGSPERIEPSKGYIVIKSENVILYVGEGKGHSKWEIEIPINRIKRAFIVDRGKLATAVALIAGVLASMAVDKKAFIIEYWNSLGAEQQLVFDFHADEKSTKELVNLLSHLRQKVMLTEKEEKSKELNLPVNQRTEPSETKFFCRYCGAENKSDAIFCEKCGKRIA